MSTESERRELAYQHRGEVLPGSGTAVEPKQFDAVEVPADLVTALRNANQEIKRLAETASAIKELIKRTMGEREYATVNGEPVIRWAHVKGRRLDMDALRANVDPAILASCYVDEVTRRFIPLGSKAARS